MDEKKNFSPNAIDDDNLEGVSGGTSYANIDLSSTDFNSIDLSTLTKQEIYDLRKSWKAQYGKDRPSSGTDSGHLGSARDYCLPGNHRHYGKS